MCYFYRLDLRSNTYVVGKQVSAQLLFLFQINYSYFPLLNESKFYNLA
jgi:hypothetical protein